MKLIIIATGQKWIEDFVDEDTGNVVSIPRIKDIRFIACTSHYDANKRIKHIKEYQPYTITKKLRAIDIGDIYTQLLKEKL